MFKYLVKTVMLYAEYLWLKMVCKNVTSFTDAQLKAEKHAAKAQRYQSVSILLDYHSREERRYRKYAQHLNWRGK